MVELGVSIAERKYRVGERQGAYRNGGDAHQQSAIGATGDNPRGVVELDFGAKHAAGGGKAKWQAKNSIGRRGPPCQEPQGRKGPRIVRERRFFFQPRLLKKSSAATWADSPSYRTSNSDFLDPR